MGDANGEFTVDFEQGGPMPDEWWNREPPDDYYDHYDPHPSEWTPPTTPQARSRTDTDAGDDEADDTPPTWAPVDLAAILAGDHEPVTPTLFPRSDGACLLYPGKTHSFHGESESGKSLLAQIETIRIIESGGRVLYLDFESDAASVVMRLQEFGASNDNIANHFTYANPEVKPKADGNAAEFRAWVALTSCTYELVVIDGVTDAMGVFGYSINDNDEIARFRRELPEPLAQKTGAAVVLIDHVTKNTEGRGRFAIGGQAKMSGLSGAGYTVETSKPLGRGLVGEIVMRVGKDRPGFIRGQGGRARADRTQEVARITVDSTGPVPVVTVDAHESESFSEDGKFRPTVLMERVSAALEAGPLSTGRVKGAVTGKAEAIGTALDVLTAEGYTTRVQSGQTVIYTLLKPYKRSSETPP